MHPTFKAGIYGYSQAAMRDFKQVNPDDVWITLTVPPNSLTIWGLNALCDPFSKTPCHLWEKSQRIHQYQIGVKNQSYGNVLFKEIDKDVVDADTVGSTRLAKNYTFDFTSIDYPNAKLTNALGINNVGDVVGYYYYVANAKHGFLYSNGRFSTLEYPRRLKLKLGASMMLEKSLGTTLTRIPILTGSRFHPHMAIEITSQSLSETTLLPSPLA